MRSCRWRPIQGAATARLSFSRGGGIADGERPPKEGVPQAQRRPEKPHRGRKVRHALRVKGVGGGENRFDKKPNTGGCDSLGARPPGHAVGCACALRYLLVPGFDWVYLDWRRSSVAK